MEYKAVLNESFLNCVVSISHQDFRSALYKRNRDANFL